MTTTGRIILGIIADPHLQHSVMATTCAIERIDAKITVAPV